MRILAIESSCDETAAAVVENGTNVLSSALASSTELFAQYGGILPELAAREQLQSIIPVLTKALAPFKKGEELPLETIQREIDAIAVTVGPGLIGSLLIGVEAAKTIAAVTGKPIIPVNHVHAHIYGNMICHSRESGNPSLTLDAIVSSTETVTMDPGLRRDDIQFPAVALVVSGGHTELFLMKSEKELQWLSGTVDDAAGEAFDKTARLLGFGNGGGVAIEKAAQQYHLSSHSREIPRLSPRNDILHLPRPLLHDDTLNFSFSGLKTAVQREWKKHTETDKPKTDDQNLTTENRKLITEFAYEVQEAITDVLVHKTLKAAELHNAHSILVAGGVAANQRLRQKFSDADSELIIHFPPIALCTDNAVTIGACAFFHPQTVPWESLRAIPDLSVELSS